MLDALITENMVNTTMTGRTIYRVNGGDWCLMVNGQTIGQFKSKEAAVASSKILHSVLSMIDRVDEIVK